MAVLTQKRECVFDPTAAPASGLNFPHFCLRGSSIELNQGLIERGQNEISAYRARSA